MKEKERVARPGRLELPTLCLEGRCSIQLSYGRSLPNLSQTQLLRPELHVHASNEKPVSPLEICVNNSTPTAAYQSNRLKQQPYCHQQLRVCVATEQETAMAAFCLVPFRTGRCILSRKDRAA